MGLLQRLLGRRDTPDSVPKMPSQKTVKPSEEPLKEKTATPIQSQKSPEYKADTGAETEVENQTATPSDTETEKPKVDIQLEPEHDTTSRTVPEKNATIEIPIQPAPVHDTEADSVTNAVTDCSDSTVESELSTAPQNNSKDIKDVNIVNIFSPGRPRRDLLTLDAPKPPANGGRDDMQAPTDSPRPALADLGIVLGRLNRIATIGEQTLWATTVSGSTALSMWLQVRQVADQTGWMPVLLGNPEDWRDGGEAIIHEGSHELDRVDGIDVEQLLRFKGSEAGDAPHGVPILPRRGDTDFDTSSRSGLLGFVKAEYSWQIPALLSWKGSTNWELFGAEHSAILRRWHEKYDVDVVALTFDVIELFVANPPQDADEALLLAQEVYAYCPDLMDSGVPTVEDLAHHMVQSRAWYLRWT